MDNTHNPDEDWDDDSEDDFFGLGDLSGMGESLQPFLDSEGRLDAGKLMGGLRAALGQAMSGTDPASGMNWQATAQAITSLIAENGDTSRPGIVPKEQADAFGLANRWLDQTISFPGDTLRLELWNRDMWAQRTLTAWRSMCAPIVASLGDALIALASENVAAAAASPELASLTDLVTPMMRAAAGEMYQTRLAQAIADLAKSTLSGTDTALPLVAPPVVALLPVNIRRFTEGLSVPSTDIAVYLMARECARQRLFAATPWLGPQILALIEHYSREIVIDPVPLREGIDVQNLQGLTPDRLAAISHEMENRLFQPASTDEQKQILERLEALICLVEGWVDTVVNQAAATWLTSVAALAEIVQRRRASQGPAERALSTLVGLQLSSRRVRDAVNLWAAVEHDRGSAARDELWSHPDKMPTAADLDDVMGFVARTGPDAPPDAMDAQLNWLVDQWRKDAEN